MAPPFLEKTIKRFADNPQTAEFAVKGLGRIDTPESRNDLIDVFNKNTDIRFRSTVVYALAEMNSFDELPFFTGLLPGHTSEPDDSVREPAVLAIGRLGGDPGVNQLASFLKSSLTSASPRLRSASVVALAAGKSR